jgi:hypothetical protein
MGFSFFVLVLGGWGRRYRLERGRWIVHRGVLSCWPVPASY